MAGSPEPPELPDSGLKCRKCRSGFLAEIKHENGDGFKSTSDLFVFSEENMPDWILQKVEEVSKRTYKQPINSYCGRALVSDRTYSM